MLVTHHVPLVNNIRIRVVILIRLRLFVFIDIPKVIIFEVVFLILLWLCIISISLLLPILNRIGRQEHHSVIHNCFSII